ncbi:kelch repeat-containing protein [Mucilaginibacter lacusdianchii]|uniref:kelch repeat-containing protein n=1 Tax=Mucilaginibacter lacusdianchii TaxID=2684211 RepID=UPI00131D38DF|nr:kelch repeat-containing protein [Mucilaginibacter sp. JXJ CY 39]
MSKPYCYYFAWFFLCISFLNSGCKKDHTQEETKPQKPVEQPFYSDVKVDSITNLSMVVSYKLTKDAKSTKVYFDNDSLDLINELAGTSKPPTNFNNSRYYSKYAFSIYLDNVKAYYRIGMIDKDGKEILSPVFSQAFAPYEIRNPYIVTGKGAFNYHPKDFFINYEGGILYEGGITPYKTIGYQDNSLLVEVVGTDENVQNYSGTLNNVSLTVSRILKNTGFEPHRQVLFDVPDDFPLGTAKFTLSYKGKLVYTTDVTVSNGGLLTAIKHPVKYTLAGCFFESGGKLYTYSNFGQGQTNFYSLVPATGGWQELPVSNEMEPSPYFDYRNGAKTINGIIYFPPTYDRPSGKNQEQYYREFITSYNPTTNEWRRTYLLLTSDHDEDRSLSIVDFFVWNNKLYCITSESNFFYNQQAVGKLNLRIFDPADGSWNVYMSFPNDLGNVRTVINNGHIYLLQTAAVVSGPASSNFVNKFYEFDLNGKSLIRKSWIDYPNTGTFRPYLVSFNGKIIVYGGQWGAGYTSLYSSLFASYDPATDKWSPVIGNSYFTAWVSQTEGFLLPINGSLYVGLGYDVYSNGNKGASKVNYTVYKVSMR